MPFPGKPENNYISPQLQALLSPAEELFYGGAAGGGKTDLILGAALTLHLKSIIFRREYPQFKGIFLRVEELLQGEKFGKFNRSNNTVRMMAGRYVEFAAMQYLWDWRRFQGQPHDLLAFDEITHFLEEQYRKMIPWNRTDLPSQRCRVICTGNPPEDEDGAWVVNYWAPWLDESHPNPAKPGELRYYASINGKDTEVESGEKITYYDDILEREITVKPRSRTFIPANVEDNPYYMDTDYYHNLVNLPEPFRSRLLIGNFKLTQKDDPWQVIPNQWVRLAQLRWDKDRPIYEEGDKIKPIPMTAIGVDPARGGDDETAIIVRYDNWFADPKVYMGIETPDGPSVANKVIEEYDVDDNPIINVDVIGIGSSVYDHLKDYVIEIENDGRIEEINLTVVPVNGAQKSLKRDKTRKYGFVNKRAELWWKFREALDPEHGEDIALPPSRQLRLDLIAPKFKITPRGVQIERKDEIVKRTGRSPNLGDACIYAYYDSKPKIYI